MNLRGLYAITSENVCRSRDLLLTAVGHALEGGARLVQYRDKWNAPATRAEYARQLVDLCAQRGAALILNDDVDLASGLGVGVHVGQADASIAQARERCGPRAIVGATCGNSVVRAKAAASSGASYVAFGRFFPSKTKPDAPPADIAVLRDARASLSIPICAIGGITPDKVPALIDAGADMVAVVEGVFGASDIRRAAAAYAQAFC